MPLKPIDQDKDQKTTAKHELMSVDYSAPSLASSYLKWTLLGAPMPLPATTSQSIPSLLLRVEEEASGPPSNGGSTRSSRSFNLTIPLMISCRWNLENWLMVRPRVIRSWRSLPRSVRTTHNELTDYPSLSLNRKVACSSRSRRARISRSVAKFSTW